MAQEREHDPARSARELFAAVLAELAQLGNGSAPERFFPGGIERIDVSVKTGGGKARIRISGARGRAAGGAAAGAALMAAPYEERPPLELPNLDTDPGVMSHMMIAESINPGHASYEHAEVSRGLRAMKAVVVNRLEQPERFGAPGAKTWKEIITAPGQWHGFSLDAAGKVQLIDSVRRRIAEVLRRANTGTTGKYHEFVETVLDTTGAAVADPFAGLTEIGGVAVTGGAYGWRTAGSSAPGGALIAIPQSEGGIIGGNQFYTLRR